MAKSIFKWSVLAVLAVYAVFAAAWARDEARKNTCSGIDIHISDSATTDSVTHSGILTELSGFPHKIVGTPLNQLDTRSIEAYLGAMPQFEDVNCALTTNGRLRINVTPMVPALRVFSGGESYYINREGKKMESKASFYVDVPVVSGNFNENFSAADVLPVVRFVSQDPVLDKLVGMIHATGPDNIYLVPRIQGHIVNFGDTLNLADKRDALLTFYRKVMPYKGWEEYDTVSVKFHGQIVATRRDKARRSHGGDFSEEIDLEESTLPEI